MHHSQSWQDCSNKDIAASANHATRVFQHGVITLIRGRSDVGRARVLTARLMISFQCSIVLTPEVWRLAEARPKEGEDVVICSAGGASSGEVERRRPETELT
jgi:hypothetical protein